MGLRARHRRGRPDRTDRTWPGQAWPAFSPDRGQAL